MKPFVLTACIFISYISFSQKLPTVTIIQDSINASFRGLSVPSDEVIWVSGSNGTVGRSVDAGKTWQWMMVPGFEKRDFRDIEAFDSLTAIIMAIDNPANILKTTDGGKNWKVVFHKEQEGMFLDAMDFRGSYGVCIGDPIAAMDSSTQYFFVAQTTDSGNTWKEDKLKHAALKGEAIFAASGTNIIALRDRTHADYTFISGGISSNLYGQDWSQVFLVSPIPIRDGKSSTGAFSVTGDGINHVYIAGGNYEEYWKYDGNIVFTTDACKTWHRSFVNGYRSCIIQTDKKTFITCGTNGVDISVNGCKTFQLIHGDGAKGKDGFNVCAKSKTGKAVYFAGTGRIAKLKWVK